MTNVDSRPREIRKFEDLRTPIHDVPLKQAPHARVFTLAHALMSVGHRCGGGCPELTTEPSARVWFIRHSIARPPGWAGSLIVVDLRNCSWPLSRIHNQLHDVNLCVHPDRVRVRGRSGTDDGHALTALAQRTASAANYFTYLMPRFDHGPTPTEMPPCH